MYVCIFIDTSHKGNYTLYGLINGLSDHNRQIIQLENINMKTQSSGTRIIHNFNKYYIHDFKTKLSYDIWDTIFGDNDVNKIFNNFQNTFLRIFYSSFPTKKIQVKKKDSSWMSKDMKITINHKRELYLSSRNSKNPKFKEHYKSYSKLLSKVIKEAKILQYKKQILTSYNKTRTTWNIFKSETGKKRGKEEISLLNINGKLIQNQQTTANSFNGYFSTTAEKLMGANQIDKMSQLKNGAPLHYILRNCRYPYPNIKFRYTSTKT
jgi:hypothetical protein